MTWLWVILVVAVIGGIIGFIGSGGKKEEAAVGAAAGAFTAGYIIFQIFLALLGFYILFRIGAWLFS